MPNSSQIQTQPILNFFRQPGRMANVTDLAVLYIAMAFLAILFICLVCNQLYLTNFTWDKFILAIHNSWVGIRIRTLG